MQPSTLMTSAESNLGGHPNPAISAEVSTDPSSASLTDTGTGETAPLSGNRPGRAPRESACEVRIARRGFLRRHRPARFAERCRLGQTSQTGSGLAAMAEGWQDQDVPSTSVSMLLKLPADERAALALTLWDSLTDAERDAEFDLTPDQETELDRRWTAHLENPASAISWNEVRRQLRDSR